MKVKISQARAQKWATLFSSERQSWETPPELFALLDKEFKFGLDACARADNTLCKRFISPEENALSDTCIWSKYSKGKSVWMNPPYGRGISDWIAKARIESILGEMYVVCLLPARTDTKYAHDLCALGETRLLRGRLKFRYKGQPAVDPKGRPVSAPFPSMITIFGPSVISSVRWYEL